MKKLIEGKVARILSDSVVVLNVGTAAGVTVGMAFVVLAQGEEVTDPESGEALGRWEVPKGYVRATHAQERLTTCEGFLPGRKGTDKEDPSTNVLSAALITHSMHPETWRAKSTPLNVIRSEVSGMPVIGPISVGDTVRELQLEQPAAESDPKAQEKK